MKILALVVCTTLALAAQVATAQTTFCNNAPIASGPAAGPAILYPSSIAVAGAGTSITTVNVQLNGLTHTFPDDLDLLLVGPTGLTLVIQSDNGLGDDVTNLSYVISDSGATALPDGPPLVAGTFKPANFGGGGDPFAAPAPAGPYNEAAPAGAATLTNIFGGTDPNGAWNLYVVDDAAGDGGTFAGGWCLEFTTTPVALQTFDVE
ncbi:MAG: hypothetical protein ABI866_13485 [Dokdonella sp.]